MPVYPLRFNLCDYFLNDERLCQIGKRTAIEFRGHQVSYIDLRAEVHYWADQILQRGVTEGDRVALLLYDSAEFIAAFLAIVSLGAVCVPINTFLSADDVAFILSDSGSTLVIAESELEEKAKANDGLLHLSVDTRRGGLLPKTGGTSLRAGTRATTHETPAFLLYTSGSTGIPKGVLHVHRSIPCTVEGYASNVLGLTSDDRVYSSSRMFFAYGLGNSMSFPLAAGATVLLEPERMNAERLTKFIEERKPTVLFGVPAVFLSLLDYRSSGGHVDFSSVRLCVSAGEALPSRIFEDWEREFGLTILDGIGSTEMLHIFISNREGNSRAGSSGRAVEGYDARLIDDSSEEVAANQLGNLWVRGGSATAGYWNRPDLTENTIVDGWVRTGDVYRQDEDGFYYHIGRSDDCFKVHGLWVSPIEVESVLVSHEAVSEAAVVCATDASGLATARAYVVIRQGERGHVPKDVPKDISEDVLEDTLEDEIRKFAGSRLPHHKVPTHIQIIEEMPRTSTGKIQRYKLRAGNEDSSGGSNDREK